MSHCLYSKINELDGCKHMLLPQSLGEIVTANIFLGDTEGALMLKGGGWLEVKNARCRKLENVGWRKHGFLVVEGGS